MLLVAYIIWCWRRTPSPGSTRALDGWAGFLSANLCVVGFWMKRRWALGFLWLAIWAVVIGTQRILAANVQFETDPAVNTFDMISIISLVLLSWTTGIVALKTPRLAVDVLLPTPRPVDLMTVKTLDKKAASASTAVHQQQQQPPIQADLIVAKALEEKNQTAGSAAPPPPLQTYEELQEWNRRAKVLRKREEETAYIGHAWPDSASPPGTGEMKTVVLENAEELHRQYWETFNFMEWPELESAFAGQPRGHRLRPPKHAPQTNQHSGALA